MPRASGTPSRPSRATAPAKITVPVLPRVLKRTRLFALLDQATSHRALWCAGPPGAGKTTLIVSYLRTKRRPAIWYRLDESDLDLASFVHYLGLAVKAESPRRAALPALTPEFLMAPSVFLRRFFERMSERLPRRSVIVFDNHQDLPSHASLHQLLPLALEELRPDISVIFLSRSPRTDAYAAMDAKGVLASLSPDALALTPGEVSDLVALHHPQATPSTCRRWASRARLADGWIAGATLLLKSDAPHVGAVGESVGPVFAYFAQEVLSRATSDQQRLLLSVSLLPEFTGEIADAVSGTAGGADYLAGLHRSRFFVERVDRRAASWYRFHPLFKDFLATTALLQLTSDEATSIRRTGGRLLLEAGRVDDALALMSGAGDWSGVTDAVLAIAPAMVKDGRHHTLARWIDAVPPELIARTPWLTYWLAVCALFSRPDIAAARGAEARAAFQAESDLIGELAAWSVEALSVTVLMGDLSPLDTLIREFPCQDPSQLPPLPAELKTQVVDAFASSLAWREPGSRRAASWTDYVLRSRPSADAHVHVLPFPHVEQSLLWRGDPRAAQKAFDAFRTRYSGYLSTVLGTQVSQYADALLAWYVGDADRCQRVVNSGVALSRREGLVAWEQGLYAVGTYNAIMSGQFSHARELIQQTRPPEWMGSGMMVCHHEFIDSWYRLHVGEVEAAWELVHPDRHLVRERVGPFAECSNWILRAYIKLETGERDVAARCSSEAERVAEEMNSDLLRHGVGLLRAACAFGAGDERGGTLALRRGLEIGRARGLCGCLGWHAPAVSKVLSKALVMGIEPAYVAQLITKRWLPRPPEALTPETWVWPIQISALGGFDIRVDGAPLQHKRKAPHRLLEVLRAIVASGSATMTTTELADRFWPQVDGDTAHENLDKTLQRLRRLLKRSEAIQVIGGRVGLNPDLCWVDVSAFEALLAHRQPASTARALHLSKGPLFGAATVSVWEQRSRARLEGARRVAQEASDEGLARPR